jgi:hypothetical protein
MRDSETLRSTNAPGHSKNQCFEKSTNVGPPISSFRSFAVAVNATREIQPGRLRLGALGTADVMRTSGRVWGILWGLVALLVSGTGAADPIPLAPPAAGDAGYIIVPHAAGSVYVPLDPSGRPLFPTAIPGSPPIPTSPLSPPAPGKPAAPGRGEQAPDAPHVGYLRVDVGPPAAAIFIDGRYVGTAEQLSGSAMLLALPPGRHQVDGLCPSFRPMRAVLDVLAGQSVTLRARLTPEGGVRSPDDPRDGSLVISPPTEEPTAGRHEGGYVVAPPAARHPESVPHGSGYFVVPRP